jgi:pantetheine-phosphate adenylyltransferase
MERIAVFPGSFDPITRGHESVIMRARPLFDKIIVAIGENSGKNSFFDIGRRVAWLQQLFGTVPGLEVALYNGLTVDFARKNNARFILRGLRTSADFEFERGIGQMNRMIAPDIETIFLLCDPEYVSVSSSIVREIYRHGGNVARFLPEGIVI